MALNLRPAPTLERVAGWYNVKQFGATGNGTTDDTAAIQNAIDAAAKVGAGVWLPPGTYYLDPGGSGGNALSHTSGSAIILAGSGRDTTKLVLGNTSMNLLDITVDYDEVRGLTLDTQTNNGQSAIVVVANNTALRRATVLGGSNTFALYYAGPSGASQASPSYNTGNVIADCIINDESTGDGFSFSFQERAVIRSIQHTGSRLALFVCRQVGVRDYFYTSGTQSDGKNGFYVTPPSNNILFDNFVATNPTDGIIVAGSTSYVSSRITIAGLAVVGSGTDAAIDVSLDDVDGVDMIAPYLEGNTSIVLGPSVAAKHVSIIGGRVPQVAFTNSGSATVEDLELDGVTFPSFTAATGQNASTFANFNSASAQFRILGGKWENTASSLVYGSGNTYAVQGLNGYNPVGYLATQPSMPASGTAYSNDTGVRLRLFVTGGTVTAIAIGSDDTGLTSGTFEIDPGESITLTYSSAPTWKAFGL